MKYQGVLALLAATASVSEAFVTQQPKVISVSLQLQSNEQSTSTASLFGASIAAAALVGLAGLPSDAHAATPPPAEITSAKVSQIEQASTSTTNLPSQKSMLEKSSSSSTLISGASSNVATAGVTIYDIFYDGKVPTTEADEFVVIKNGSKDVVDISGYYIYVATTGTQGPTFTFPKGSTIKPNQSLRIYTNEIHPETGGFSFKSGRALWNNKGGLAVFKDNNGKKIAEYKYKPSSA